MSNILKFLNIGKADFDRIKFGLATGSNKGATVVDINKNTYIPMDLSKKKNKNDFYRFLLSQSNVIPDLKINNDILIPRSILKNCGPKQKRSSRSNSGEE